MTSKRLKHYFTKNWKKNTVAPVLYKAKYEELREAVAAKLGDDVTHKHLAATNPARAALWDFLTSEQQAECVDLANAWNEGRQVPPNIQK
jgi:hypothetical protein